MSGDRHRRPDHYANAARERGYPARSVFKLEEIDRRLRLLRPGARVLDLGAAPGSWALYAAQQIGSQGRLLAVDLQPLGVDLPAHAQAVVGDALALGGRRARGVRAVRRRALRHGAADVGHAHRRRGAQPRAVPARGRRRRRARGAARGLRRQALHGRRLREGRAALAAAFGDVKDHPRPPAVRSSSVEVYLCGRRGQPTGPAATNDGRATRSSRSRRRRG